jgi:hypothetical protein
MHPTSPTNGTPHNHAPTPPPPQGPGAPPKAAEGGRDSHGRFAEGNPGGPGNPFARQVAALRTALLAAVTPQDIEAVARELLRQAKEGNVAAAKLLLSYTLGKPPAAVDPDTLDAQEWENYQRVADPAGDLMVMARRMPLDAGLTVARALLPGLTDVWAGEISDGLRTDDRRRRRQARREGKAAPNPAPAAPRPSQAGGDEQALERLAQLLGMTDLPAPPFGGAGAPSANGDDGRRGRPRPPSARG